MTTPTTMPAEHADWVATEVLTRTYLNSCGGVELVRMCRCQYGRCGHCGIGRHRSCATRVGWSGNPPAGPHTHIVDRNGAAVVEVWTTGKACRWTCSCTKCAAGCFVQDALF